MDVRGFFFFLLVIADTYEQITENIMKTSEDYGSCKDERNQECEHGFKTKHKNDILLAAKRKDWNYLKTLTEKGANLNIADGDGKTAIMWAAESGNWDMVHWLLGKGADINVQDNFLRSVLHIATTDKRWHDIRMLVNNGSYVNATDHLGRTPLIISASQEKWDTVQWLIKKGANINARDGFGRSVLLLAASSNNWQLVKWLLIKGADPTVTDRQGRTVLHLAAGSSNLEVVQLLVEEFGANFEQEDKLGNTPINVAAIHNDPSGLVYNYLIYIRQNKYPNINYRANNVNYVIKNVSLINRAQRTFNLIKQGNTYFNLKHYRKAILVLGNPGSGKSTLIQFLTQDLSELKSQEVVQGSRAFKIVAKNGSSVPSSIFPRFVLHEEKRVVLSDGPGFSDTGSISRDLSVMHFIRKVARKFKSVKIIFTISHLTCKRSMHGEEYYSFLRQATSLIRDYPHFAKSMLIVITKMEDMKRDLVETELERPAATCVGNVWQSMKYRLDHVKLPPFETEFYKKAVDFLNIFIKKNEKGKYDRIATFRRPKSPGLLSEIRKMVYARELLEGFIFNELPYVEVKPKHFGYPLSLTKLATIYKTEHAINNEISAAMISIAEQIKKQVHEKAKKTHNLYKIRDLFKEICKNLQEMLASIKNEVRPRAIIGNIRLALEPFKIYPRYFATYTVQIAAKLFVLLQKIMDRTLSRTPVQWIHPFSILLIQLKENKYFFEFLINLLKFQVQNKKPIQYDVDKNNIETFIKFAQNKNIIGAGAVQIRHFHAFEIDMLNKVLHFAYKEKSIVCKDSSIEAKGSIILFSSILKECGLKFYSTMKIYASSKVVMDETMTRKSNDSNFDVVTIIAPEWKISQKSYIFLNENGSFTGIGMTFSFLAKLDIVIENETHTLNSNSQKNSIQLLSFGNSEVALSNKVTDYRVFCTDHVNHLIAGPTVQEFLKAMDSSTAILSKYNTQTLLYDLIELEESFIEKKGENNYLLLYESLLKRIDGYLKKPQKGEDSNSYKLALSTLYTAAMSKVMSLRQGQRDNIVLNIIEFFRLTNHIIEQVKEKGNRAAATQHREKMNSEVEKRNEEAKQLIEEHVKPVVKQAFEGMNETLNDLTKMIDDKIAELEEKKKELEEYKKKLESSSILSLLFGIIGLIGSAVSCLGPYGQAAGAVLNTVSSVGKAVVGKPTAPNVDISIPNSVQEASTTVLVYSNLEPSRCLELLEKVKDLIKELPPELMDDLLVVFNGTKNMIKKLGHKVGGQKLKKIFNGAMNKIKDKTGIFVNRIKNLSPILKKGIENLKKGVGTALKMVGGAVDGLMETTIDFIESQNEIDRVNEQIKEVDKNINQLKEFKDKVKTEMVGMIQDMQKDMDNIMDSLKNKTQTELSIQSFQLDQTLRDAKCQLSMMLEGWGDLKEKMGRHIDNLKAAMDIQIEIFQKLADYKDQVELAQTMNDMANPDIFKAGYPPELKSDMEKLEVLISSNLLLNHREKAIGALKQWVFPFAHDYLGMFNVPKELNYKSNLTDMVKSAKKELETIQLSIMTDAAVPTKRDRCTLNYNFYSKYPKGSFYIWKNAENTDIISDLFSGEEVTVNADIVQKLEFNAVKFRFIKLSFQVQNNKLQHELNEILNFFEIKLTHMGNSRFHCDGKVYTMTGESLEIRYAFLENSAGTPTTTSEVFNKLRQGDVMLSPYAMWKIQLLNPSGKGDFGKLLNFIHHVDLVFEGDGQYLNEDCISQCNQNMEDYYKADEMV